jgi:hypothetical protein
VTREKIDAELAKDAALQARYDAVLEPMSTQAATLPLGVAPEVVEQIAQRAAEILAARQTTTTSPWLTTQGAADHLACPTDRIHDLVQLGKLTPRRDGRRRLLTHGGQLFLHRFDFLWRQLVLGWCRCSLEINGRLAGTDRGFAGLASDLLADGALDSLE